ncbi:MAG: mitomycin resistance protein [Elusimicrobia bacterium]|nr:mitomycin resistance protein [Elusimicrobiota bacterium]
MSKNRRLEDLVSVGPATLEDLRRLGVRSVAELARREPRELYRELCRQKGRHVDICCLDTFAAAVAQAKDPALPAVKRFWWYWSRQRKKKV